MRLPRQGFDRIGHIFPTRVGQGVDVEPDAVGRSGAPTQPSSNAKSARWRKSAGTVVDFLEARSGTAGSAGSSAEAVPRPLSRKLERRKRRSGELERLFPLLTSSG